MKGYHNTLAKNAKIDLEENGGYVDEKNKIIYLPINHNIIKRNMYSIEVAVNRYCYKLKYIKIYKSKTK